MAQTREVITRALRRIRVVGLLEDPSHELMRHGLEVLQDMLSAFEADGLTTETVTLTGDVVLGSRTVTGLDSGDNIRTTADIVVGMDIVGTGVVARVFRIVSAGEIEMDQAATQTGSGVSLVFTAIPFDDSLTDGLVALLAVRLAEDFGATVGPILMRDASRGRAQISGMFFDVPSKGILDGALLTASARQGSDSTGHGSS